MATMRNIELYETNLTGTELVKYHKNKIKQQ
jgi:hypothetical protein